MKVSQGEVMHGDMKDGQLSKLGDSYRLLAACFYQPQKEMFQDGLLQNLAEALKDICPPAADCASEMIRLLQAYSDEELLVDYSRLFVGPSELVAAPYGSIYLEREGRLMGDSTMAAVDFYMAHGLEIDSDFREVPDHIAVELEFMYYLVFKEAEAIESGNLAEAASALKAREMFMHDFLRPWVNTFATKMAEGAETVFYRALSGCLSALICKTETQDSLSGNLKSAALS